MLQSQRVRREENRPLIPRERGKLRAVSRPIKSGRPSNQSPCLFCRALSFCVLDYLVFCRHFKGYCFEQRRRSMVYVCLRHDFDPSGLCRGPFTYLSYIHLQSIWIFVLAFTRTIDEHLSNYFHSTCPSTELIILNSLAWPNLPKPYQFTILAVLHINQTSRT